MAGLSDVVVLLPGISGSALSKDGQEVWGTSTGALWRAVSSGGGTIRDLALKALDDPSLDDLGDGVRAIRVIPDLHLVPGFWKIDGYSATVAALASGLGLRPGENLFEFPYDWRRANEVSARGLARAAHRWLAAWRERSGRRDAKLVLVAHSMGGLVARHFLEAMEGWRQTRALITFGTPFRGSLDALGFLANGYSRSIGPFELDFAATLRSFTSVYELLPTYPCLDTGDGTLRRVSEAEGVPNLDPGRTQAAKRFHDEIERQRTANAAGAHYREAAYRVFPVVGVDQPTFQAARATAAGRVELLRTYEGREFGGDGTVPRVSAVPLELSDARREMFASEAHGSLQNARAVLAHVQGVLSGTEIDLSRFRRGGVEVALGLDVDDAYEAQNFAELRARAFGGQPRLLARIFEAGEGRQAEAFELRPSGDGLYRGSFRLAAGLYRVTVSGLDDPSVGSVTDSFAVLHGARAVRPKRRLTAGFIGNADDPFVDHAPPSEPGAAHFGNPADAARERAASALPDAFGATPGAAGTQGTGSQPDGGEAFDAAARGAQPEKGGGGMGGLPEEHQWAVGSVSTGPGQDAPQSRAAPNAGEQTVGSSFPASTDGRLRIGSAWFQACPGPAVDPFGEGWFQALKHVPTGVHWRTDPGVVGNTLEKAPTAAPVAGEGGPPTSADEPEPRQEAQEFTDEGTTALRYPGIEAIGSADVGRALGLRIDLVRPAERTPDRPEEVVALAGLAPDWEALEVAVELQSAELDFAPGANRGRIVVRRNAPSKGCEVTGTVRSEAASRRVVAVLALFSHGGRFCGYGQRFVPLGGGRPGLSPSQAEPADAAAPNHPVGSAPGFAAAPVAAASLVGRPGSGHLRHVAPAPGSSRAGAPVPSLAERAAGSAAGRVLVEAGAPAADLTVKIFRERFAPPGCYRWSLDVREGFSDLPESLDESINLGQGTADFAAELLADCAHLRPGDHMDTINGVGERLFNAAPECFRKVYWQMRERRGAGFSIQFISEDPHVPWELMRPHDGGARPAKVLVLDHPVARWIATLRGRFVNRLPDPAGRIVSIAPRYPRESDRLPWAEAESHRLCSVHNARPLNGTVRDMKLLLSHGLPDGQVAILHFAGHGSFAARQADTSELLLEDGSIRPSAVRVSEVALGAKDGTFVVLNACEAGAAGAVLGSIGGWAEAFTRQRFRGVLAPLWSVRDEHATKFVCDVIQAVWVAGEPVGEALRRTREAHMHVSSTAFAYVFYGDVTARFARR